MTDIATLAKRIDAAADPDAYFGTLAFCLERCHGDLPVASELADIAFGELQFDAAFETAHPRHGDGRFRSVSNSGFAAKKGHRQKIQSWEKGVFNRSGEADERESPLPKTKSRRAVEQALDDPGLMADLTQRARRMIGRDLQSAIDPEDVVQSAVMRGLKEADQYKFESQEEVAGWLHTYVRSESLNINAALRAFKRRGDKGSLSLDEELDVAERVAESGGSDATAVLGKAIAALDDKDRDVFVAYYGLDGKNSRGKRSAKVRQQVTRIKAKLREHLESQSPAAEKQDDPSPQPATDEAGRMAEAGFGKRKGVSSLYQVRLIDKLDELGRDLNLSAKQMKAIKKIALQQKAAQFDDTNSVDPLPDHITSVGHKAAIGAMDAARSAIADLLKKNGLTLDNPDLLDEIERILNEAMPSVAQTLTESTIYAHIRGADDVLKLLDKPLPSLSPPSLPPGEGWLFPGSEEDEPPIVRFPVLEAAARRIAKATIMSPEDYYRLGTAARENAFTITADLTQESVAKIRDALYENLREGPSADDFARTVDGLFEEGMPLARSHLEQVFRNNVNGAWSDGHDKALRHELVSDAFPYRAYTATHDQRVRDEHLILEHTGLSGTNIYLASDPVFQTLRPPWSWSCRCSFYPVSITQAARKGVEHAQRWLEQAKAMGVEPEQTSVEPEHVDWPTLNGERIMPPPQWQRDTQFDDARKRYVGPPGYGKEVVVQSLGHATQVPPRKTANIHDTADWMREPLRAGEDYELFKTYSRPGRFGQSFAKTGVSETAITQEHETEKFLMALGVPVPATRLVNVPSKHGGSRSMKVADWLSDHQKFDRTSQSHRSMIRPHLVAQALLGNEDLASTNVKVGPQGVTFIDVGSEGIGDREPANLLSGIQGYIFEHSPQEMLTPDEYRQQVKQIGERLESALQHVSDPTRRERLRRRYAALVQHDGKHSPGVPYWPPGEPRSIPQSVPRPQPQWPQVRPFSEQFDEASEAITDKDLIAVERFGRLRGRQPSIPASNPRPRASQLPGNEPLPESPAIEWGDNARVAPLPHARRMAAEINSLRQRFPRLAALPIMSAQVELHIEGRPEAGGLYRMPRSGQGKMSRSIIPVPPGKDAKTINSAADRLPPDKRPAHVDRHEYGHHLWVHLEPKERADWNRLHQEWIPDIHQITPYGATDPTESFAELFAMFTHDRYQDAAKVRLPQPVENYFRRILSVQQFDVEFAAGKRNLMRQTQAGKTHKFTPRTVPPPRAGLGGGQ